MNNISIDTVVETVKEAQRMLADAQDSRELLAEAKSLLNQAENIVTDIQLDPNNIEDRQQLQQAIELLLVLQDNFN